MTVISTKIHPGCMECLGRIFVANVLNLSRASFKKNHYRKSKFQNQYIRKILIYLKKKKDYRVLVNSRFPWCI